MTKLKRNKLNYAVVGLGGRSSMYTSALLKDYRDYANLVGYCDINQTRMDYYNSHYKKTLKTKEVPTYSCDRFDDMIRERKVDCVIATTVDRTHHRYIIRAMEMGCDVITEKPLTVDEKKCGAIISAKERTKKELRVTFNYRYVPIAGRVKELINEGVIGKVLSVHFEWLLDTRHGADYFRRWHRDKKNSGGLMVHKATHHFDLANWWIGSFPETVFGMGDLAFYGRDNAEERGITKFYNRAYGNSLAQNDPWAIHLEKSERMKGLYLDAEHEDGYIRDQNVFGDNISIEDDMGVMVRYKSGAKMTYHLTAYSPWEGYRVMFNGTGGRLEVNEVHNSYVSGSEEDFNQPALRQAEPLYVEPKQPDILLHKIRRRPVEIPIKKIKGGHGGGDVRLLDDIFRGGKKDPLGRSAGLKDGVLSIITGIAANKSFSTGQAVEVERMIDLAKIL